jgi:hypothetical protein
VPTTLQVVPYDVLLKPGEGQQFRVRLFNAAGQLLSDVEGSDAQFALDGQGEITPDGRYTAPADAFHECALVSCKVGDLTGTARVRITPPLPWSFEFNDAQKPPLTWIGGRVRWEVRDEAGEKYLAKRTVLPTPTNPNNKLGTRSFVWMGPIDLSNYTIQGDVLLKEDNGRMADVGLINGRYQLNIRGRNGKLRLDSWTPSDYRAHAETDFDLKPDLWYTLKLKVIPESDTVRAMGKVWPRDEAEPDEWTVDLVDEAPNLQGTPGIYGNTPDVEVYLDNVKVTAN